MREKSGGYKFLKTIVMLFVITSLVLVQMKLEKLNQNIENLNSRVSHLDESVSRVRSDVSNSLHDFTSEKKWVNSYSYDIISMDLEGKAAVYEISVLLNELAADEEIYFSYGLMDQRETDGEYTKIPAVKKSDMGYGATIPMEFSKNYDVKIIAESDAGTRLGDVTNIRLKDRLDGLKYLEINVHTSSKDGDAVTVNYEANANSTTDNKVFGDKLDVDYSGFVIKDLYIEMIDGEETLIRKEILTNGISQDEEKLDIMGGYDISGHTWYNYRDTFEYDASKVKSSIVIRFTAVDYYGNITVREVDQSFY